MRKFISISLVVLVIILVACCNKEDSFQNSTISVNGKPISYIKIENKGFNGGKTFRPNDNSPLGTKTNTLKFVEGGLFLTEYPLVEYRYVQEVLYDSLPIYEIDTVTQDTLNMAYEIMEVSRDTLGFVKGPLWWPVRAQDHQKYMEAYFGISEEELNNADFQIKFDQIDSLNYPGSFALTLRNPEDPEHGDRITMPPSSVDELTSNYYEVTNEVPVYDENGIIISY